MPSKKSSPKSKVLKGCKIMIYTKTGDNGTTSLVGGSRVSKCTQRVKSYGTVDELNSHMGLTAEMMITLYGKTELDSDIREQFNILYSQFKKIQNTLFVIQTLLATEDSETYKKLPQLNPDASTEIENWIDSINSKLPKLNSFVIPGGSMLAAQIHVTRTVCRRAERETVQLNEKENVEENILKYINRLSDYLFVVSRFVLYLEKKKEIFWSAE